MFEQVKLDYATNALEPWIDQLTIETHYGKHHVTYTKNFNDLVEKAGLTDKSVEEILGSLYYLKYKNLRPDYIKAFWEILDWAKVSARYDQIVG